MSDARKTWKFTTFEGDGRTTVHRGLSRTEAVSEIYRVMGGLPAHRKPAHAEARGEKVAA